MQDIRNIGRLCNRLGELTGILDECLNVPNGNAPVGHKNPANDTNENIPDVTYELHKRHDHARDKLCPPG